MVINSEFRMPDRKRQKPRQRLLLLKTRIHVSRIYRRKNSFSVYTCAISSRKIQTRNRSRKKIECFLNRREPAGRFLSKSRFPLKRKFWEKASRRGWLALKLPKMVQWYFSIIMDRSG